MNSIFKPAIKLMNRLHYKVKLILMGMIVFVVVFTLTFQLVSASLDLKKFSQKEIYGVEYINPIMNLMIKLQDYRQLTFNAQQNLPVDKTNINSLKDEISLLIDSIDDKNMEYGQMFGTNQAWATIKSQWKEIETANKTNNYATLADYSTIIKNIHVLIVTSCDASNLTLDPDIDTYYLMDTYCTKLPRFSEDVALIRLLASDALQKQSISAENKDRITIMRALINNFNKPGIAENINKITQYNSSQLQILDDLKKDLVADTESNDKLLGASIVTNMISGQAQELYNGYSTLLEITDKLIDKTGVSLVSLLKIRLNSILNGLYTNLSLAILGTGLLIYLFIGVYISTMTSIRQLANGSDELAKGGLDAHVDLEANDELRNVARSFNTMKDIMYHVISETEDITNCSKQGHLTKRMSLEDKKGFVKKLAVAINEMNDTFEKILADIIRIFDAIANGNLEPRINNEYQGVFNELKENVNTTITNLQNLIHEIKLSADLIRKASEDIAHGNSDLAKRTEQQATFLEETSTSTEQLTANVKQNAENAKQANALAQTASSVATKGGKIVNEVVETMATINESSRKVVDIIGVIDGIAFQTNLLALNAAVEAARAGDQGRGFVVVATEVRNLAQRTSAAAKEIKELIINSVDNISIGVKLVEQAGKTMGEIVTAIDQVTGIMGEITIASSEQSVGIEQVNQAVTQMEKVVDQNVTLVDQAATTAESLKAQTNRMNELVSLFKFDTSFKKMPMHEEPSKPVKQEKQLLLKEQANQDRDNWEEF